MIGVRVLAFSFIPGFGFATAASTLVGQYLGAERPDRAEQSGWRAAGGALAVMSSGAELRLSLCISGPFPACSAFLRLSCLPSVPLVGAHGPGVGSSSASRCFVGG